MFAHRSCTEAFMRLIASRIVGAALLGAVSFGATAQIDVMTQNQYVGADLSPVFDAATADPFDPAAFNAAIVDTLKAIAAGRPADHVRALAADIAQRNPDVVGLQEVHTLVCLPFPGVPPAPDIGCDDPEIRAAFTDHLADTDAALRGKYVIAGKVTNTDVAALPFVINGIPALVSLADRDAILVRAELIASWVDFGALGACPKPSDQGCNYLTAPPPLSTPVGPLALERGFLAVDVTVKGQAYRVFNTHLEQRLLAPNLPQTRLLQVGQAWELAGTALGTWDGVRKMVVGGDFNSAPEDTIPVPPYPATLPGTTLPSIPPYAVFVATGFTDAWTLRPQADEGFTCCQAEDLANRTSSLDQRIDMIFTLPRPSHVLDMQVLGDSMGDKTHPAGHGGLWPSDHAALAARLQFN
jgi:endonuclease/exonuclease/phosphatase family metal-dependent hydrolase